MLSEHLRAAVMVSDLVWRGLNKLQKLLQLAHDIIASLGGDHSGSVTKFTKLLSSECARDDGSFSIDS